MTNLEILHDDNEKARREAETIAGLIVDINCRNIALQCIREFYDLMERRIDKGVYREQAKAG